MEASSSARAGAGAGRSLAQTFCLAVGIVLILVGIIGFLIGGDGTSFEVGEAVQGDLLIVFEVNGWHNIVHILSGVFLVAMASRPSTAVTGALIFGAVYVVVTIWGVIAGDNVLFIAPINLADNLLHLALAILGLAVGLAARSSAPGGAAAGGSA
jgi:Domain of unknown function (DUF4383)